MILRPLCALWPSPFSWCPSDLWVFNFPHPRLQQTVVMLLYLLIPTWVVALPWNCVAAATNIGNCLCWWHPGLRNQECSGHQGHEPQWCLYPSLAPRGALSTHKTLALSSFIPACLSECLGQGWWIIWVTDTELVSELVYACHISFPWKVSPVFQTYPKPETKWSSPLLFISHFGKEHCEMILWSLVKMFLQLSVYFHYPKEFIFSSSFLWQD